MSRKTRRKIANLRADAMRRKRETFKWLPIRWGAGWFGFWSTVCAVVFAAAGVGALNMPGLHAHEWITILVGPIWFMTSFLADRATRPLLGRYLADTTFFDFRKLWEETRGKGPKSAQQELRRLCEEGTLLILDCQDKGVKIGETEVWAALKRIYGKAEELSEAITEFEDHKPEDPKAVEVRLRQKLRDEALQIKRDHIAKQLLAQLHEANELADREAQLGIASTTQDVIDELRGTTAGNQEIAAVRQPI